MAAVARVGDPIGHGRTTGVISGSLATNVQSNNLLVATVGSPVVCFNHPSTSPNVITSGASNVSAGGALVATEGSTCTCGATVEMGSTNVSAG